MKNSFMIAFALVGTAAVATAVEKACKNSTSLSEDTKARLIAAVEAQCAQFLSKVQLQ
jgi:hypothetical protein